MGVLLLFNLLFLTVSADYNLVLYTHGLFQTPKLSTNNDTIEIAQSGFQTIILWTIHVDKNANLIYNDDYIVSNGKLNESYYGKNGIDISSKISQLKSTTNSNVKNILFGIGSGPPPVDFSVIASIYKNPTLKQMLYTNLQVLMDLGANGFDYDCEEFSGSVSRDNTLINVIVDMVYNLNKMGASVQTFVPYNAINSWMECLKDIYKNNNKQLVSWWNVQCYSGGNNNRYDLQSEWINNINKNSKEIGVNNGSGYIVPGFSASSGVNGIQNDFKQYGAGVVDGGFLWNWPDTTKKINVRQFDMAVVNGLNGK
eukprot:269790_1